MTHTSDIEQAFKSIFTSPSSASSIQRDNDENAAPPTKRPKKNTTRQHVAALLGMTAVTGRAIAYVAVQVCSRLSICNCRSITDISDGLGPLRSLQC
jgi:hypothetical protein